MMVACHEAEPCRWLVLRLCEVLPPVLSRHFEYLLALSDQDNIFHLCFSFCELVSSFISAGSRLREAVTGAHTVVHIINCLKLLNTLKSFLVERSFVLKRVQDNSFKQIAKGNVVVFCECFEHFYHSLFHSDADLHAFDWNIAIL